MQSKLVAVLLLAALTGCTRGTKQKQKPDAGTPGETAAATSSGDADWDEGRLPPLVREGTPKQGGTLVVRLHAEPPSLDKITDSDLVTTWMLERKVLESMAELDADKHPEYPLKPLLAESWTISEDGLTFTFKLKKGVTWHDGKPFTGQDVVATVKKILDPNVRAMHLRNYFEELESIATAPGDDYTVVAKYRKRYFLAFRSLATLPIYPKHVLDVAGNMLNHAIHRAPVGTGPFRFKEWDAANKRIVFERFGGYWGRKAYLDRLVYRLVEDPNVAFQLLQRGEFDVYTNLLPSQWVKEMPEVESLRTGYRRVKFFDPNYSWIGWNTKRPYFQDARVRLAMTHLLDRDGMLRNFLLGISRPTTCHFYAESSNCDASLAPRPYDPAKAKALLDEAGWKDSDGDGLRDKDGVPFKVTFLITSSSNFLGKLAPYMQQELKKAGIALEIKKVEWALYTQKLREHDFDICSLLWGNNDVVDDPFQIWHSSQEKEGSNYISFADPEADALIEKARLEMDDAKRSELYRGLGRILYDKNPYTFLYNRPSLDAVRANVRGIRPAVPWYDFEDVWLEGASTKP